MAGLLIFPWGRRDKQSISGTQLVQDLADHFFFEVNKRNICTKGIRCMMLTGDNKLLAKWVSDEIGLDEYFAEVLPQDKAEATLSGFGTFKVSKRKASTGRNPRTGEELKIKAKSVPKFSPGKALRDTVA
jgi:Bacterial DNA-binding protein